MILLDKGFWVCPPDTNVSHSLCSTPPAPHPCHLRPGPQALLSALRPFAAPPEVILLVELGAGPVLGVP